MPLTDRQKGRLLSFIIEKQQASPLAFAEWLLAFLLATKSTQIAEVRAWLDAQRAQNTQMLAALDQQRATTGSALQADTALLDELSVLL